MADSAISKSLDEIIKERHISGRMPRAGNKGPARGAGRGMRGSGRFRGGASRGAGGMGRRSNNGAIQKRRSGPAGLSASPNKAVAAAAAVSDSNNTK